MKSLNNELVEGRIDNGGVYKYNVFVNGEELLKKKVYLVKKFLGDWGDGTIILFKMKLAKNNKFTGNKPLEPLQIVGSKFSSYAKEYGKRIVQSLQYPIDVSLFLNIRQVENKLVWIVDNSRYISVPYKNTNFQVLKNI